MIRHHPFSMQLHQIKPNKGLRRARRVGRGGKRGTYSGRGIKGQRARAGAKVRPSERDILKKIPKLRGYKFRVFRSKPIAVRLSDVVKKFREGETVTPTALLARRVIRRSRGKTPRVKIVGAWIDKQFFFKDVIFSKSVGEKMKRSEIHV